MGPRSAWGVCTTRPNLRRTTAIALCVGACLVAINQLQPLLNGPRPLGLWLRVGLDFAVPFVVSNLGVLSESRRRHSVVATEGRFDPIRGAASHPDPGRLDSPNANFYATVETIDRSIDPRPAGTREKST
jgi:hypothetical protein